jgi:hypothetical protein
MRLDHGQKTAKLRIGAKILRLDPQFIATYPRQNLYNLSSQ